mgnify:CR=1 FL=1
MRSIQQRLQSLERKAVADTPATELLLIGWEGADFSKAARPLTEEERARGGVVFQWVD